MLGRGNRIPAGRIQHDDAAVRGRVNVDVVDPHPSAPDHAQLRACIQNIGGDCCLAAYDKRTEVRNKIDKLFFA